MVTQIHLIMFIYPRFVKCSVLAFLVVLPAIGAQNDNLSVLDELSWYDAAKACRDREQKLYNSTQLSPLEQLNVSSGKYWVGAKVMYSPWIWTDNSTLFTYVGYRQLTDEDDYETYDLYENEAVRCYSECRTKYIGLQGTKCFCLDSASNTNENNAQDHCWGNSFEYCGTGEGISIYKREYSRDLEFEDNDLCGYATFNYFDNKIKYKLHTENNCQTETHGRICKCVCEDNTNGCPDDRICIYHDVPSDWFAANKSCTLMNFNKFKSYSINHVWKWKYYKDWINNKYWIGLSRFKYIGFIDRYEVIISGAYSARCLLVERLGNGTLIFGLSECTEQYKSVCVKEFVSTTASTTVSTSALMPTPSSRSTSGEFSPGVTTSINTNSVSTETNSQTQTDAAVVGGSIGAIVGVVMLVLLLVIIWMKRTKRHCFREKSANRVTRHMPPMQNVYELADEPHTQSDYSESNHGSPRVEDNTLAIQNGISDYELEQDMSRRAQPQIQTSGEQDVLYELVLDPSTLDTNDKGDYDELHAKSQNPSGQLYSHVNLHSQCDVDGHTDTYDRATFTKEVPSSDSTYNHIHNNLDASSETYDTATFTKEVPSHDSTYNHIH